MSSKRDFPNSPSSVREARQFASSVATWLSPESSERLALLVSELATNALIHAGMGFSVVVEQVGSDARVEVSDRGDGTPTLKRASHDEVGGRGLEIVQSLARSWGTNAGAVGKTVWFVV